MLLSKTAYLKFENWSKQLLGYHPLRYRREVKVGLLKTLVYETFTLNKTRALVEGTRQSRQRENRLGSPVSLLPGLPICPLRLLALLSARYYHLLSRFFSAATNNINRQTMQAVSAIKQSIF